jgi:predicted TPR repeat methyltransferase
MPTSSYRKVGRVMDILQHVKAVDSVLDVGVGFGKFGFLLREFLDVRKRRYSKSEWRARIDGVEVYSDYLTVVHTLIYDNLYVGDIRELVGTLPKYDLIVLADVIEHMPYEDGVKVLTALFSEHCNKGMVVSFPNVIGSDWKNWANPHERHHHVWTPEQFRFLCGKVVSNGAQIVYILKEI